MLGLSDLVILLLIILAGLYWWHAQGIRQLALAACRTYCENQDVQLLDETVSLLRMWGKRDEHGRLRLWRMFSFEFTSTGVDRHKGKLVMLGDRVLDIYLEPQLI